MNYLLKYLTLFLLLGISNLFANECQIAIDFTVPAQTVARGILSMNQLGYLNRKNIVSKSWHRSYDLGYGVWNAEENRPETQIVELLRRIGIVWQRYPGGCMTHYFDWKLAIGPYDQRPHQRFGLPEFLRLCEAAGTKAIITLPEYRGTAEEAAELVEYLNAPDDGQHPWATKRTADGRKEPWNVIYFEYGNETYHGNHLKGAESKTIYADQYTSNYLAYRAAMKAVDPRIQLGAVIHDASWNKIFFSQAASQVDFLAPHAYTGIYSLNDGKLAPETLFSILLAGGNNLAERLREYQTLAQAAGATQPLPVAVTEFNCHIMNKEPVIYRFTLGGALIVANMLRQYIYDPNVFMANYWQFANEGFGMVIGWNGDYVARPTYHVYRLYNDYLLDNILTPSVDSPVYDSPGGYGVPRASGRMDNSPDNNQLFTAAEEAIQGENLLPPGDWTLSGLDNPEFTAQVRQAQSADGVLEVEFLTTQDINYYHAARKMPASPLLGYVVTAEVRTEGMEKSTGVAMQIGDGRGWDVTRSVTAASGIISQDWVTVESPIYTPLVDTDSLVITVRRLSGASRGKMFVRKVRVTTGEPVNMGAQPVISAVISQSGDKTAFLLINKSMTESMSVRLLDILGTKASAETLTASSIIAVNDADNPHNVVPKQIPIVRDNQDWLITLPKHSLTGIMIE